MESAWRVTGFSLTPAGRRYTVALGRREWIVLHADSGWQFWNGQARCDANAGVRAAVLDYEKDHPYTPDTRAFTTTREDIDAREARGWNYEDDGWMEW